MNEFDGADGALAPKVLCATTVQVYVAPFVSPVTVTFVRARGAVDAVPVLPVPLVHVAV
jgi:hypothetical protein